MLHRSAKPLRIATAVALGLLLPALGLAEPPHEGRDPDAPVYCVQAWTEARYRNYAYDHIVHLYNGCTAFATCEVATNVAPKPVTVRVKPGELKEVLTYRGSPSQEFVPRVRCALEK